MIIPAMDFLLVGDRDWSWVVACCNRYEWGVDLPFVAHDGESDSWVCRVTNTVSLLPPNKASNARFIFPPCSLGTTSISHRTLNHIVSCRPCIYVFDRYRSPFGSFPIRRRYRKRSEEPAIVSDIESFWPCIAYNCICMIWIVITAARPSLNTYNVFVSTACALKCAY